MELKVCIKYEKLLREGKDKSVLPVCTGRKYSQNTPG